MRQRRLRRLGSLLDETEKAQKVGKPFDETKKTEKVGKPADETKDIQKVGKPADETKYTERVGEPIDETKDTEKVGKLVEKTKAEKVGKAAVETTKAEKVGKAAVETAKAQKVGKAADETKKAEKVEKPIDETEMGEKIDEENDATLETPLPKRRRISRKSPFLESDLESPPLSANNHPPEVCCGNSTQRTITMCKMWGQLGPQQKLKQLPISSQYKPIRSPKFAKSLHLSTPNMSQTLVTMVFPCISITLLSAEHGCRQKKKAEHLLVSFGCMSPL